MSIGPPISQCMSLGDLQEMHAAHRENLTDLASDYLICELLLLVVVLATSMGECQCNVSKICHHAGAISLTKDERNESLGHCSIDSTYSQLATLAKEWNEQRQRQLCNGGTCLLAR
jgi:hypothetical protein